MRVGVKLGVGAGVLTALVIAAVLVYQATADSGPYSVDFTGPAQTREPVRPREASLQQIWGQAVAEAHLNPDQALLLRLDSTLDSRRQINLLDIVAWTGGNSVELTGTWTGNVPPTIHAEVTPPGRDPLPLPVGADLSRSLAALDWLWFDLLEFAADKAHARPISLSMRQPDPDKTDAVGTESVAFLITYLGFLQLASGERAEVGFEAPRFEVGVEATDGRRGVVEFVLPSLLEQPQPQ